jgi:glycosyltransferase involved in cell wall biosynthesis
MSTRTCVLFLIPSLVAHGAERQLCELVRHLDRDRFEVHVAVFYDPAPGGEGDLWAEMGAMPDLALHRLHKRQGALGYPTALPRLLRLALRIRADLIHGYMDGNLPGLLLGALLRRRVIWGIRRTSRDLAKLDRLTLALLRVMIRCSPFVDLIIFNSEAGRLNHAAMGMKAPRMEVVANGFDVERFRPDPARGAAQRSAWGVPPEAPLIGLVGRLQPVKDHPTFLRAAAQLAQRWPEARFICIGGGPARHQADLEALAASLGLLGRVQFPGATGDMPAAYNALSCLVLASTDEGFPNVLGEAMACGVPCVTTRVGDAEALVGDQGWVVAAGDAPAMAQAVTAALLATPEERAARAEASRLRICTTYSVTALARQTERLLLSLLPPATHTPMGCL